VARAFLKKIPAPVVAPSANLSGRPPAVTADQVPPGLDYVIDAGPTRYAKSSTVVRADADRAEVLRDGAVPRSVIDEFNYFQILFVCTGNTCRSPMAAALAKQRVRADVRVLSAGTAAGAGVAAFEHAITALNERGVSLAAHRSQPVTVTLIEDSNLVFVMTESQRRLVLEWAPDAEDRVRLLDPDGNDIKDPMFGDLKVYRECAARIDACLEKRELPR
jgi:protein-tyrosine phosphatase